MQPSHSPPEHGPGGATGAAGDALIDLAHARHLVGFVLRSLRRHARLVWAVFGTIVAAAALAFVLMPRTYHTQSKILAQQHFVMPALGNPQRAIPREAEAPTRLASEAVMSRENLEGIIRQTNLLSEWRATRAPVLRLKDRLVELVAGPPTEEEQVDALVGTLERRLWVTADEGTVTISIDWPDANTAFHIVERAQLNFIEQRHASEVSSIRESIGILEGHASNTLATIEQTYEELRRSAAGDRGPLPAPAPRRSTAADDEIAALRATLSAKRLAIGDLEEFQRRRLAELQTQLAEQRNSYGAAHPAIANTQRSIAELTAESPQLAELRRDERTLLAQLRRRGVGAADERSAGGVDQSIARAAIASIERARSDSTRAERESYVRTRLKIAERDYEDLLERLDGARIELETARAAFKYRYGIVTPAQVPKKPAQPNPVLFLIGGLMLASGVAVFAAVAVDVVGGRALESWQVERTLGLPVLAEIGAP